jgi:hypothetical protein
MLRQTTRIGVEVRGVLFGFLLAKQKGTTAKKRFQITEWHA